jgi:tetratricopeptide (TPR) repeat protein
LKKKEVESIGAKLSKPFLKFKYFIDRVADNQPEFFGCGGAFLLWSLVVGFMAFMRYYPFPSKYSRDFLDRGIEKYESGEYLQALDNFRTFQLIQSNDNNRLGRLYFYRALTKSCLSDSIGAKQDFIKAIKLDYENISDYYRSIHRRNDDYFKCPCYNREILDSAVIMYPDSSMPFFYRARMILIKGDTLQAVEDLDKAVTLSSNNKRIRILKLRAECNSSLGRIKEAIEDYSILLDRDPKDYKVLSGRGKAKLQLGDTIGGCVDLLRIREKMLDKTDSLFIERYCPVD